MNGKIDPAAVAPLKVIAGAMGLGIALLSAMIVYFYFHMARIATPASVHLINMLTAFAMGGTAAAVVVSEALWKSMLAQAGAAGDLGKALCAAFIVRAAWREGSAMLGCVACLLAALNGVLRANPAYWLNMAPAVLFWAFLFVHWPSVENLEAELSGFPRS